MKLDNLYTIKEAGEKSGYDDRQIMYKIRRNHIEAQKVGWIWVITEPEVAKLKEMKKEEDKRKAKRAAKKK